MTWYLSPFLQTPRTDRPKMLTRMIFPSKGTPSLSDLRIHLLKMALSDLSCTSRSNTPISHPASNSSARCFIPTSMPLENYVWISCRTGGVRRMMSRRYWLVSRGTGGTMDRPGFLNVLEMRHVHADPASLLNDPNTSSPANVEASNLYKDNRREYTKRVRETVEKSWDDWFFSSGCAPSNVDTQDVNKQYEFHTWKYHRRLWFFDCLSLLHRLSIISSCFIARGSGAWVRGRNIVRASTGVIPFVFCAFEFDIRGLRSHRFIFKAYYHGVAFSSGSCGVLIWYRCVLKPSFPHEIFMCTCHWLIAADHTKRW